MEEGPSRKLAVILHADVVGSTSLVQANETLAHERIRDAFQRFSEAISARGGTAHEVRGDALVAEFPSASDAVEAALKFQADNTTFLKGLADDVKPVVRMGIAMGEVVVADDTVTGEAVVLAQRLEQLAEPGGVCIQGIAQGTMPRRLPYVYESLGERELKGFGEPVRAFVVRRALQDVETEPDTAAQAGANTLKSAERPSIAVLPFESNGEPELADGLTNDLITDLGKFGRFAVAAPHSTLVYKGQAATVLKVARELSVDYVLEGRVQWSGNRARISAQLSDGTSGQQVWAERYNREVEDIFDLQDELVSLVSASVAHKLDTLEANRTTQSASASKSARDLYASGREIFFARTRESNLTAAQLLVEAIELDQNFGRAYGFLGWIHAHDYRYGWSGDPEGSLDLALELALKGFSLDPTDYESHWRLGVAYLHRKDFEKALLEYDKAKVLNPSKRSFYGVVLGGVEGS